IARPATSRTPPRTSSGSRLRAVVARTTRACKPTQKGAVWLPFFMLAHRTRAASALKSSGAAHNQTSTLRGVAFDDVRHRERLAAIREGVLCLDDIESV